MNRGAGTGYFAVCLVLSHFYPLFYDYEVTVMQRKRNKLDCHKTKAYEIVNPNRLTIR